MALIFPRIARNVAKNGFFPTDDDTVKRIGYMLAPSGEKTVRVLDPCCGEGVAVQRLVKQLGLRAQTYGVELDTERAVKARSRLTRILWSDFQDTSIESGAFDLLFLNPPYGSLSADKAATGNDDITRFEELFVRRSIPTLAMGGVMILIIPVYEMRAKLCTWLARSFSRLVVRRASVDTYKQVVIFGVRRRSFQGDVSGLVADLMKLAESPDQIPDLPDSPDAWIDPPYVINASGSTHVPIRFVAHALDPVFLEDQVKRTPVLWSAFENSLGQGGMAPNKPPLHDMSDWHIAMLTASGQSNGLIVDETGYQMLVKGQTNKTSRRDVVIEYDEDGLPRAEVTTVRERFVASIRALDLTPGSPRFGECFTVQ